MCRRIKEAELGQAKAESKLGSNTLTISALNQKDLTLQTKLLTLEYRIVVGLRLFINQIFFENVDEKKK